jgi:hypothetical protein
LISRNIRILKIMSSRNPPVPPASRSNKGPKNNAEVSKDKKLVKHEHHANAAEEGTPPISNRTPQTKVTSAAVGSVDGKTGRRKIRCGKRRK